MYTFISHFKHPVLVMRPFKNDRDGNVLQEPKYIRFDDNVFQTNDEELATFIRGLFNFGADYFETNEVPKDKGYQGHSVGITKMENPQARLEEKTSEIAELKNQIEILAKAVSQLMEEKKEEKPKKEHWKKRQKKEKLAAKEEMGLSEPVSQPEPVEQPENK